MAISNAKSRLVASLALSLVATGSVPLFAAPKPAAAKPPAPSAASAPAAKSSGPSAQTILAYQPSQKDVQIDRPESGEIAKCTVTTNKSGYILRDGDGDILRNFFDSNGDNAVDQWSYYKDGVEVFRDIDSNKNNKPDQCRWLNTAGTRWGVDANEDGKIDVWKMISAEEVTAELVAAVRDRDQARFARLLVPVKEAELLGLGAAKTAALQKMLSDAQTGFGKFASGQKLIGPTSKWVSFGGFQPGVVPQGTDDSKGDLMVYENVMAMVETDGKAHPFTVGAIVRKGDTWRLIDLPQIPDDVANAADYKPFFFAMPKSERPEEQQAGKPSEKMQDLMKELEGLGEITPATPARQHERRAEILEQLAKESESPEMRVQWYQNLADTLSAAVQTGSYPAGIDRLKALHESLSSDPKDASIAFYVKFRWLTAEHTQELAKPNAPFADIQKKWIDDLTALVDAGKQFPDSADAMMELAIAQEFGGDEEKALKLYETISEEFPNAAVHKKATGAKLRLNSVGKSIPLKGKPLTGGNFDLNNMKGKAVLIQYWATWCEPCKADMPLLKELRTKFGKEFEVVGVCLDQDKKEMLAFLKQDDPRWPQLFEEGGLDSPLANELGIQTLPTMILVDKQGKVVNRNIRAQELEGELKKLLK